ncbi:MULTISPECIES: lyase family protein [unclassified Streptomyces]|uniref:argininosuccinate lyase n=1 Tax=unclassified Streptomyces TaxID=2593676 RepID=UPI002481C21C|nr:MULTISPECIES: lyase family protein [unclassified Streptomyces]MDA5282951.1 lyase family protein [Streptomyces sp. Isolate_45]MDX2391911.1 lyase family protein [Streptomyces sp. DK15]
MNNTLSGRISNGPSSLLRDELLDPQFAYEAEHLLPYYVKIERALVAEYARMRLITEDQAGELDGLLAGATRQVVAGQQQANMSDIAFALERHVENGLSAPVPTWHLDRSRNDLQACAQLMFARGRLIGAAESLLEFHEAARRLAEATTDLPMPGYTHHQAAQIITPGFYLAALSEHVQHTLRRLLATYDGFDACPLGAGAMSGQELPWDRDRMAALLGFRRAQPNALMSVASRGWALEITAEFGVFGVALSRFATDLLAWGSSEYGFIDLPDELSGISSAMPQKKNFPILERIRGRSAHLSSFHIDVTLGQRNTPYSNTVEVSKEAGAHVYEAFETLRSTLRLFTEVLRHLTFRTDRMAEVCEREFLGGFALANSLTLAEEIPWRRAQVIAGKYIVAAVSAGLKPADGDPELLRRAAEAEGHVLRDPGAALGDAFDVGRALHRMKSTGSAHPDAVGAALDAQQDEHERLVREWAQRAAAARTTGEDRDGNADAPYGG